MWIVYLLRCSDSSIYTGITNNLPKRLSQHQKGTASKYTRSRLPVSLLGSFWMPSKSRALKEEYRIKQLSHQEKMKLIRKKHMQIKIIAAVSLNGVLGDSKTNNLPWGLDEFPEDMKHFRETTKGSTIVMGSKTMHSIGRALPKRRNIVISRSSNLVKPDPSIEQFSSLSDALGTCGKEETVWIIGGAQIYQLALPLAAEVWITTIPKVIEGEGLIYFPYLNHRQFALDRTIELSVEKGLCCDVFVAYDKLISV